MSESAFAALQNAKNRISNARKQYESLLLRADSAFLPQQEEIVKKHDYSSPSRFQSQRMESPLKASQSLSASPTNNSKSSPINRHSTNPLTFTMSSSQRMLQPQDLVFSPPNPMDTMRQQTEIINDLKEENDLLKEQLEETVTKIEDMDAQQISTKDDWIKGYELRLQHLIQRNHDLEKENHKLSALVEVTSVEHEIDRENLQKALRIIDRSKRRHRSYLEVQRKAHKLLTNLDGQHCFTIRGKEYTTASKQSLEEILS